MGIGSVTSMNSMSGMQMTMAGSADSKSKSIRNKITNVQQQMQKVSSQDELSANEKANERKKLQKEISGLNTELKQRQEEFRKSQRREIMMAELQEEDKKPEKGEASEDISVQQAGQQETGIARDKDRIVVPGEEMDQDEKRGVDTGKKQTDEIKEEAAAEKGIKPADRDTDEEEGLSRKEIYAMTSAETSVQQSDRLGTVIARIRGGIAVLKGEMDQDERYGADTEKKQSALEKMEEREQRARTFQSSILGEANNTMKSVAKAEMSDEKNRTQINTENNAFQLFEDEGQALQQRFYVSLGN